MQKDYCTIFSKMPNSINLQHVDDQGNLVNLTILPDYNINVDARKFSVIRKHTVVQQLMEAGMLSEVKHMNTKIEGEAIGLKFVDTDLKEQAVVVDQNLVYATNLTFQPSKDKLIAFHGVTSAIADKMLEKMPPGGWQDKRAFLDDPNIAKFEIDWNPDNIKPERVV